MAAARPSTEPPSFGSFPTIDPFGSSPSASGHFTRFLPYRPCSEDHAGARVGHRSEGRRRAAADTRTLGCGRAQQERGRTTSVPISRTPGCHRVATDAPCARAQQERVVHPTPVQHRPVSGPQPVHHNAEGRQDQRRDHDRPDAHHTRATTDKRRGKDNHIMPEGQTKLSPKAERQQTTPEGGKTTSPLGHRDATDKRRKKNTPRKRTTQTRKHQAPGQGRRRQREWRQRPHSGPPPSLTPLPLLHTLLLLLRLLLLGLGGQESLAKG